MRALILVFFLFSHYPEIHGQWNQYEANWQEKPGRMMVNMEVHQKAPLLDSPFLVEFSNPFFACDDQGLPSYDDEEKIEEVIKTVEQELLKSGLVVHVGRFFYQCSAKDYFYVSDTSDISKVGNSGFNIRSNYKIVQDPEWNIYFDFIYPDDYLLQTMDNKVVIDELGISGFDFTKKYLLTHFAAFSDEYDRKKFRTFLLELNFKILEELDKMEDDLPFLITFSRKDKIDLERLSNTTLRLDTRANALLGSYMGWEIELE